MADDEWATATARMDQVNPGEWEWSVIWSDGDAEHRTLFRPIRDDESRCNLARPGEVCCLAADHDGPHVPVGEGQAALPFIIAP
jgi:hypothetical protein